MAWKHKPDNVPKIALCVPHTGNVSMEWAHRTWGPLVYTDQVWCEKRAFTNRGPPIHLSREFLVDQALNWGANYIFFIDSDVIIESPPDPNHALRRLLAHNLPIVSGLYRAKKSGSNFNPWAMWKFKNKQDGFESIDKWNSKLVQVDVVGLGCCLIKAEVFDKVPKAWFRWDLDFAPSEDFYFLMKARTHEYDTIVDTTIRASHVATMKILPTADLQYDSLQV